MKAKCPTCFGESDDCEMCDGTGFISAGFAAGLVHSRLCKRCGRAVEGAIVGPKTCPESKLLKPTDPCVFCGGETYWEKQ